MIMSNQRQFIRRTAAVLMACGLIASLLLGLAVAQDQSAKPNILWIYFEDMNPWFGCYGDPTVPTPNMNRLARDGVLFERCYVPVAVCSPTRSAYTKSV
jgi:hypothetical protein